MTHSQTLEMFKYLYDKEFEVDFNDLLIRPYFVEATKYIDIKLNEELIYELLIDMITWEKQYQEEYLISLLGGKVDIQKLCENSETLKALLL